MKLTAVTDADLDGLDIWLSRSSVRECRTDYEKEVRILSRYRLRPPHGLKAASRVRGPVSFGTGNR